MASATSVPGSHRGGNWMGHLGSGRQAFCMQTPGTVFNRFADAPFQGGRSLLQHAGSGLLHEKIFFYSIGVFARRSVMGKSKLFVL